MLRDLPRLICCEQTEGTRLGLRLHVQEPRLWWGRNSPPPASESPFLLLSSVVNVQEEEEEEGELQKHDRGQFSPLLGPPFGPREGRKQVYNDLVEEQELLLYIARTSP